MRRREFVAAAGAALFMGAGGLARAQAAPTRVVIAGGDLTEIVYALGLSDRIVGVDSTSIYPEEATSLPQVGYVRRLSSEGVLSLEPELFLVAHDAGPPIALEQIRAAGVAVAIAPPGETPDTAPDKIEFVARALGREAEARRMIARYRARLDEVRAEVARLSDKPRVLFILSIRDGAPIVAGEETSAAVMIASAAGVNAATGFRGFKPMSQEAVLAAQPDAVLMMSQHAEQIGGVDTVLARPEFAPTPAARNGRGIAMNGMLLLGFGPRTPDAVAELAHKLRAPSSESGSAR